MIERLGDPPHVYDRDGMLAYRVFENEFGKFSASRPARGRMHEYELVLQFDDRGLLRRHSVVAKP